MGALIDARLVLHPMSANHQSVASHSAFNMSMELKSSGSSCPAWQASNWPRRNDNLSRAGGRLSELEISASSVGLSTFQALPHMKQEPSYPQILFHRLRARCGPKKAICAVAASMLTAIYHTLQNATLYQDPGADHFNRRAPQSHTRRAGIHPAERGARPRRWCGTGGAPSDRHAPGKWPESPRVATSALSHDLRAHYLHG